MNEASTPGPGAANEQGTTPRKGGRAVRWRGYGLLLVLGGVVLPLMAYVLHLGMHINAAHAPLIAAAVKVKLETTTAHLNLEGYIGGDPDEEWAKAAEHLSAARRYAQAMADGGEVDEGVIIPLDAPELRRTIGRTLARLADLQRITQERAATPATAGIGTALDQRYDAVFREVIVQADALETVLRTEIARRVERFRHTQYILMSVAAALLIGVAVVFFSHEGRGEPARHAGPHPSIGGVPATGPRPTGDVTKLLVILSATIFGAEAAVMAVLPWSRISEGPLMWLVDAGVLTVICFPCVYWAVVRPLRRAEEEMRGLAGGVECAGESVLMTELDGTIRYVNPAFTELTGYAPEEAVGQNPRILKSDRHPPEFYEAMWKTILAGEIWSGEIANRHQSDTLYDCHLTIAPIRNPHGTVEGFVAVQRDITERKQAEARMQELQRQLAESQKMDAIGRLAGGVAHDFNNLLTAIEGHAELIAADLPPDDPGRESVCHIRSAAKRCAELTANLLAFGRASGGSPVPTDVRRAVSDIVSLLQRTFDPRISVSTHLEAEEHVILAPPGQLARIVLNLCVNARDAMPDGGRLSVTTQNLALAASQLESSSGEDSAPVIRLTVSDTGVGMDAEIQAHVFEPFFTTKEVGQGSGFGLATVYAGVRQSGGRIRVRSAPGEGSTFEVDMPTCADTLEESADQAEQRPAGGTETVLLAEDEELVRGLIQRALVGLGYTVLAAADGEEALARFDEAKQAIDLVILDASMPRVSGPDVFRRIRAERPDLPVILVSGHMPSDFEKAREEIAALVAKPYGVNALARTVREVLDAKPNRVT